MSLDLCIFGTIRMTERDNRRGGRPGVAWLLRWLDQIPQDEPHVGGPFGEPSHVPRKPGGPIADQDPHRTPFGRERTLVASLDAVEHVDFVAIPWDARPRRPFADSREETEIVCAEDRKRLTVRGALQQPLRERAVGCVDVALAREGERRRLAVGSLHEADRWGEGKQTVQIRRRTT